MIVEQQDHRALETRIGAAEPAPGSAVSLRDTARAPAAFRDVAPAQASAGTDRFAPDSGIRLVAIGGADHLRAVEACARNGRDMDPGHPDTRDGPAFAYAGTNDARRPQKGDPFSQTDLA